MIKTGLVSISFRNLDPLKIVEIVKQARLNAIEWGGDIHVPHGDVNKAKQVKKITNDSGLEISAYGSYYKVGESERDGLSFQSVIDSACCLGTDTIRVWAGSKGSAEADDKHWKILIDDAKRICEIAAHENIIIALEYHCNTLTDKTDSAVKLLTEVKSDNLYTFWQPAQDVTREENLSRLDSVFPWLLHIHVFHWKPGLTRHLLMDGADEWEEYFVKIKQDKSNRYAALEYFKDDSITNFFQDAASLKEMLSSQ